MDWAKITRATRGRAWLVTGALAYLGAVIPSIIRSAEGSIGDVLYTSADWLAACIIYFFLGAFFGHLLDWWIARKRAPKHPLWFWLTAALWAIGSIAVGIFAREGLISPTLAIFFPFAFGIFFTGSAFTLIAPWLVQTTLYGKLLLDLIYLTVFGAWLYLSEWTRRSRALVRVLLLVVFAVLFLGIAGCVRFLS